MNLKEIMDLSWVSILCFALCLGYGVKLLITKDPLVIRGKKDNKVLKDPEKYAVRGGQLLLFLAGGSLVMTIVLLFDFLIAVIIGVICLLVFSVFWKRMNDLYGPL